MALTQQQSDDLIALQDYLLALDNNDNFTQIKLGQKVFTKQQLIDSTQAKITTLTNLQNS